MQRILPGRRLGGLVAGGSPPSGAAAALHACTSRSLGGGPPPTPNTLPSSTASGYNVFLKRSSKTTWLCQRTTARSFPPSPSLLSRLLRPDTRHICSVERGEKCSLSLSLSLLLCHSFQQARLNAFRTTSLLLNAKCSCFVFFPPERLAATLSTARTVACTPGVLRCSWRVHF